MSQKIEWFEVDPDERRPHPSDYECRCEGRKEDEYLLHVTEGTVSIEHTVCGKTVPDDGYIEVWSTVEPIPITARFVDLGMSPATPNGPAEHDGYWWELGPRGTDEVSQVHAAVIEAAHAYVDRKGWAVLSSYAACNDCHARVYADAHHNEGCAYDALRQAIHRLENLGQPGGNG